jgi:hypothetical protein
VATLTSVSLDPTAVLGGDPSTGTVTLDIPAPVGGAEVALSSDNAAAQVPASVTVLEGQTTATFTVTTTPVVVTAPVVISATYNAVTQTANLTVTAPVATLTSVSLDPTAVLGGDPSTGTVTLDIPAPVGGAEVALSSDNAAAQVPASVTVLEGQTTATFTVTTTPVVVTTPVVISATYNAVTQTANLTVTAPVATLTSVSLDPTAVLGGDPSTGTVTLDIPAPVGGAEVSLSSDNPAASVPASVTVLEGQTTATFTVTTTPVVIDTPVVISATYNAVTQTANLTVTAPVPAALTAVSVNPETVVGGTPSTGTVFLSNPAPVGGATVVLISTNTTAAQVPSSVTVLEGQTTATFVVTTFPVISGARPTIIAAYNGINVSTRMLVTAPIVSVHTISPSTVQGGTPSTGTVSLDGPAPAGGLVVTLSSNRTAVAQVPASITIPAGEISATYVITTYATTTTRTATISARGGNVTVRADITITP